MADRPRDPSLGCAARPSALGAVGVAWSERGVTRILIGERSIEAALVRLEVERSARRVSVVPPEQERLLAALVREASGEAVDHGAVVLDERDLSPFRRDVARALREVPRGLTVTYGELAASLGRPGAARAVGRALGQNPFPLVVPCHRVVGASGNVGGFSLPGGVDTKRRLLAAEAARGGSVGVGSSVGGPAPRTCLAGPLPLE